MRSLTLAALLALTSVSVAHATRENDGVQEKAEPTETENSDTPVGTEAIQKAEGGFTYDLPDGVTGRFAGLDAYFADKSAAAKKDFDEMIADYSSEPGDLPPANTLEQRTEWKVTGESKRLLVMTSANYTYSGGAHGMFWTGSLIWDKETDEAVAFLDLFKDPEAAKARIMPAYCAALDAERLGIRGEPTPKDDLFGDCPEPFDAAIYPDTMKDGRFMRIAIVLPPYMAGPYVEGEYNLSIPAPSALTDLMKPEYAHEFQDYM